MTTWLICGGRSYNDRETFYATMTGLLAERTPPDLIIQGAATGADTLARLWAHANGIRCLGYEANWQEQGKAAGPIRNQLMLDTGTPELVIAFPGGRGTADMARRARKAGVEVLEL